MATHKLALATVKAKRSCVVRGYVEDEFIGSFAGELERCMDPTMNRGYHARMAAVELVVREFFLGSVKGPCQIVVLGAGFDTGYWRRKVGKDVEYYEIDVAAVCEEKQKIMRKQKLLTGENYHLVACDLGDVDKLEKLGLDKTLPTLFVAECVFSYLEEESLDKLLKWTASFERSACVSYDIVAKDDAFGKVMRRNFQERGWPVLSPTKSLDEQKKRFSTLFQRTEARDMHTIYRDIILATPQERKRINSIEIFDDPEEFQLLMEHYCLVLAANGDLDLVTSLQRKLLQGPTLDPPPILPHLFDKDTDQHQQDDKTKTTPTPEKNKN